MLTTLLRLAAVALLLSNVPLVTAAPANAENEPKNVLFLVVDDLNTWLLGDTNRYAGKVVAPNIRRLADSGVIFNRADTASPVCSPSRTALLSGVSPWKSGVYDNGLDTNESPALGNATSLPQLFQGAGYYAAGQHSDGSVPLYSLSERPGGILRLRQGPS